MTWPRRQGPWGDPLHLPWVRLLWADCACQRPPMLVDADQCLMMAVWNGLRPDADSGPGKTLFMLKAQSHRGKRSKGQTQQ